MAQASLTRRLVELLFSSKNKSRAHRAQLTLERLEERAVPAQGGGGNVWLVTTGAAALDGAANSLRWAIANVDAGTGGDTIDFAIPNVGTVATINLTGVLPAITQSVTINGYSQGGNGAQTGRPWVQLDGTNGNGGMIAGTGLQFTGLSGGSVVQGLAIYDFDGNGISLAQTNVGITVQGCYVGNNEAGNFAPPDRGPSNSVDGILVKSNDNTIGGATANTADWITDNGANGVDIVSATGNFLANDTIGCGPSGNGGNGLQGVRIFSSNDNFIGATNGTNYIIGNGLDGVFLDGSSDNVITENNIGTNSVSKFANAGNGVHALDTSVGNEISYNDISGNAKDGILLESGVTGTEIWANVIGLTGEGSTALGNGGNGVHVQGGNNTVGFAGGSGNVISGNAGDGVFVDGSSATDNVISSNFIGTDYSGIYSIGNGNNGIEISGSGNTVGGTTAAARNVISGNVQTGVLIELRGNNLVKGNYIGTNIYGTAALQEGQNSTTPLGNGACGIIIGSNGNTIGRAGGVGSNLPGNVISNNGATESRINNDILCGYGYAGIADKSS